MLNRLDPVAARVVKDTNDGSHGHAVGDLTVLIEQARRLVSKVRQP